VRFAVATLFRLNEHVFFFPPSFSFCPFFPPLYFLFCLTLSPFPSFYFLLLPSFSSFPYPPLFVLPLWHILRFHLEGLRFVGCSTGIGLFCNTPSPRKGPRFAREAHAPASCQPQSPLRLTIRASMFCVYKCVVYLYVHPCSLSRPSEHIRVPSCCVPPLGLLPSGKRPFFLH